MAQISKTYMQPCGNMNYGELRWRKVCVYCFFIAQLFRGVCLQRILKQTSFPKYNISLLWIILNTYKKYAIRILFSTIYVARLHLQ